MTCRVLASVIVLVAMSGCKNNAGDATAGSGTAVTAPGSSGSAAIAAPPPVPADAAAPRPYALPTGAKTLNEREAHQADATALGASLGVTFVDKLGEDNDGRRHVDELVVLTGTGSLIVDIGADSDDSAAHAGAADGSLTLNAPLSPPRAFTKDDAKQAPNLLPFKGPLLYLRHGAGGEVAIAHDGDAIVAWRLMVLHGEGEEGTVQDWFEQARIKLAPGAKVVAN